MVDGDTTFQLDFWKETLGGVQAEDRTACRKAPS